MHITDIWNSLTESEKRLCIRYPFDALKVNTARKIATEQTERKFGYSGLGDRSDAFRPVSYTHLDVYKRQGGY